MSKPKLILLVGPPGAGKTTYARKYVEENRNTIHLSSDVIRKDLWGDESIQGDNNEVFSIMQDKAIKELNNGLNVIYDATNMTRKDRSYIISLCPKFVQIEAHIVWTPIETCIQRDAIRNRTVGKEVIDRMLKKFQAPYYDEGLDEIKIILPNKFNQSKYTRDCVAKMAIPHDNPHHTLDIYQHCETACEYACGKNYEFELEVAALLHDVGKPYVKAFVDRKGNPSEVAHFYQHQCTGSYMSYGFPDTTPFVAWLISTHMDPFLNTKYYHKLPPYLKEKVDLLHEADLAAH